MDGTTLLLVDVQKDFHPGGSLAIPTADKDAERIAALIQSDPGKINRIVATMDTHQVLHIAHPAFWVPGPSNTSGKHHPDPFTIISSEDLEKELWIPRGDLPIDKLDQMLDRNVFSEADSVEEGGSLNLKKYCVEYARRLEKRGRFQLCIWPEHCLIGSTGHGMVDIVLKAVQDWSRKTGRSIDWVMKGQNLLTEMYSALEADVAVSKDTSFNERLFESLVKSKRLIICGQAMSHCVNYTARDIVARWPADRASQVVLLTDCASAVPGFEAAAETFKKDMQVKGVKLCTASEIVF